MRRSFYISDCGRGGCGNANAFNNSVRDFVIFAWIPSFVKFETILRTSTSFAIQITSPYFTHL